ncbi:hypothetical protein KAFR_0C05950 [Kazachstania africana CBS 2517]|uniref:Uncharacterized protein n=1 Tax=Kazachstania africana (strain ATCC 22294 / BCRC 22015 / CBS 2517 / CECT 1963 / NBRC 1671 / NRRL Y-8276) TaxID=1071382 RepID=H2AT86_KAZAF|nr:hypothetical protein KAFR_0C05950 [Kazachstania africana CBS 2517]CCF57586.1 hypothetical protein KAFR_0C05950 [Kazachstania africana CBS 2517]
MGIQGLLPQLKPIQNPVTLHRYEGQTLGIDGYAWLHRAAFACSYELVMNEPTEKYLQFFIKKIRMLKSFNIEPYFIFDGDSIPVKKNTELKRRDKRVENKEMAMRLWNAGEKRNAMDFFQKCVDITPEMAKCVIEYCKINNIKYVVAPFEADSQMVYLEKKGLIHGIISEDSDLLIFGCKKLITKLNDYGECIEIRRDDFSRLPKKFPLGQLNDEQIRAVVCLSGCDYTDGIPKIGLLTAFKLVNQWKQMEKVILYLQREGKWKIPANFLKEYSLANYAFQFQRVFCPVSNRLVTLNEIPKRLIDSASDLLLQCIGPAISYQNKEKGQILNEEEIDHSLHARMALGESSPYDYRKPLISRECKLQLVSKSEVNIKLPSQVRNKLIDSFFDKTKNVTPKAASATLLRNSSITKTISGLGNSQMRDITNKLSNTISVKRRKLQLDEDSFETLNTLPTTSKYFRKRQLTPEVRQELGNSKLKECGSESEVETEIPDSCFSTQIPSSFQELLRRTPTATAEDGGDGTDETDEKDVVTSEDEDTEDISEVISEPSVAKINKFDAKSLFIMKKNSLEGEEKAGEILQTRKLSRSSTILDKFKYSSLNANTNEAENNIASRVPLSTQHPNKNGRLIAFLHKASEVSTEAGFSEKKRPCLRRSIVRTTSSGREDSRMEVSSQKRTITTRNTINLTVSASQSDDHGKPVSRPASRSVSLLTKFVYKHE